MKIGLSGPILFSHFRECLDNKRISRRPLPVGLGGTAVYLISKGLIQQGYEVVIFTLDPSIKDEVILEGPQLRICVGPYRRRARYRAMDMFWAERGYISRTAIREKPDIIHAHWTYEFALGALASGVPTLVTVRDWAPRILRSYKNAYRFVRFIMDCKTFRQAHNITANSHYIRDLIWRRFGRKVPVVPNPIEDFFLLKTEKSLRTDFPIIVSINTGMSRHKNVKNLITAFKTIRQHLPTCQLKLIGEDFGPGESAEKCASEMRLNEGIDFVGALQRTGIINALDEANVLIHPSLEESFGNTLIEAMARRVPVIGGRNSGAVPWVLDNGSAGVLCDVEDPENIAQAAIDLLQSEDQWQKLSTAGYQRVASEFTMTKVIQLCTKHYQRILEKRNLDVE